jgi:hypothetical protein
LLERLERRIANATAIATEFSSQVDGSGASTGPNERKGPENGLSGELPQTKVM